MSSPDSSRIVDVLTAYWQSAALTTAIELGVFSALGNRTRSGVELARRCKADAAALVRLCDYLVALGLLRSAKGRYTATPATRLLDSRMPGSLAALPRFFMGAPVASGFADLAATVRSGKAGTATAPRWPVFARATLPLRRAAAKEVAIELARRGLGGGRILDVGAGASPLGVELLRRARAATLVARDRTEVLKVVREHAAAAGVEDRVRTIAGDVVIADWAGPFDLVVMMNVLDYFDGATQLRLLRKARQALRPGGALVVVAPLFNTNRRSPPEAVAYDMLLLALGSPARPATWRERRQQLLQAGFTIVTRPAGLAIVLAQRAAPKR
jgi:SAM-dependent methyltransferase